MKIERVRPGPGQESVWDYPRPPRVEPDAREPSRSCSAAIVLADTRRALRVLETSHPPDLLPAARRRPHWSTCARPRAARSASGRAGARYFDVVVGRRRAPRAAWSYPTRRRRFAAIARPSRLLRRARGRLLRRRRARAAAARRLLRRLDHRRRGRPVQGRARHARAGSLPHDRGRGAHPTLRTSARRRRRVLSRGTRASCSPSWAARARARPPP